MPHSDALQRLNHHYQSMPPVAVMDLRIAAYDGRRLQLHAPLASWGLVSLQLEAAGIDADVFVADSQIRYLAPLFDDIEVGAELGAGEDWATFIATLRQRGRARTQLVAKVPLPAGGIATEFTARYVAIARR